MSVRRFQKTTNIPIYDTRRIGGKDKAPKGDLVTVATLWLVLKNCKNENLTVSQELFKGLHFYHFIISA